MIYTVGAVFFILLMLYKLWADEHQCKPQPEVLEALPKCECYECGRQLPRIFRRTTSFGPR